MKNSVGLLVVVTLIACGGAGESGSMGSATLTPSTTNVTPYQVVTLVSNVQLSGMVTATSNGVAVAAGLANSTEVALVVPNLPGTTAAMRITVGTRTFAPIAFAIGAAPTLPSDPATYVMQSFADDQATLSAMAASSTNTILSAYISVAQMNLTALAAKFQALSASEQEAAALFLAANNLQADALLGDLTKFIATGAAIVSSGAIAAALGTETLGGSLVIESKILDVLIPQFVQAEVNLGNDLGLCDNGCGSVSTELWTDVEPAPVSFMSNTATTLPLSATFRSIQPSDTDSPNEDVAQAATYLGDLSNLVDEVNSDEPNPFPSPPAPSMMTQVEPLDPSALSIVASSVTGGVSLVGSTMGSGGLSLTFKGPGSCTTFTFDVTYNDGVNPRATIPVNAQIDCAPVDCTTVYTCQVDNNPKSGACATDCGANPPSQQGSCHIQTGDCNGTTEDYYLCSCIQNQWTCVENAGGCP